MRVCACIRMCMCMRTAYVFVYVCVFSTTHTKTNTLPTFKQKRFTDQELSELYMENQTDFSSRNSIFIHNFSKHCFIRDYQTFISLYEKNRYVQFRFFFPLANSNGIATEIRIHWVIQQYLKVCRNI